MGQTYSLFTKIEINAPPDIVRSVLLDFEHHKNWHATYVFKSLDPKIKPIDLRPGDKLDIEIRGYTFMGYPYPFRFQPTIRENIPELLEWNGGPRMIFNGTHSFIFSYSRENPSGTTFIQSEVFTGLLAFLVGQNWEFGRQSLGHFQVLSQDLKTAAEQQANGLGAMVS
ncbi:unnamed protein product [Clonostachys chloroleuca]|uniref:SRPBCC domain-containing protein n=1 Tax=Clonostachys chloroleuca TaxID=1926264 RepID=A0AA35VGX2_9HYPO|nr:unnamed protein product [Clonostachys chloroleuca]